ncbi:hypothetical protein M0802_000823 [Mischocyttarus mexicanus]|nr:hypothetical protein M0802_000823 [Mischocyttarus mexicanus]
MREIRFKRSFMVDEGEHGTVGNCRIVEIRRTVGRTEARQFSSDIRNTLDIVLGRSDDGDDGGAGGGSGGDSGGGVDDVGMVWVEG